MLLYNIFLLFLVLAFASTSSSAYESDRSALLDFKGRILNDPLKIMSSWNDSTHFCDWMGVTCNSTVERVVTLDLEGGDLTGSLPSSLGNLTYLTKISLGNNKFRGPIPQEFGRLLQLRHLNLSYNNFGGEFPRNISHCIELIVLEISGNGFIGQIPHELSTLTKLERFMFGINNMTGTIPAWVGNFSSILAMSFGRNNFHGSIPSEIGRLSRMEFFTVVENSLTGTVPPSIYNITFLNLLHFTENRLQGTLPPNIGFTLPNLQSFAGGINNFSGPIPKSLANISTLQILDFPNNNLVGMVPNEIGGLNYLERLNFGSNSLGSGKVGDLNFISSLVNCTRLRILGLNTNHFGGVLPLSIANLSNQLIAITLGENMLSGSIPLGITNLINLQVLAMESNMMNGSIPPDIGKFKNLVLLYLGGNRLIGPIPSSIGNLTSLTNLYLSYNKHDGRIPTSLGECKSLVSLELSTNNLSGTIPNEIFGLTSLSITLTLDHNSFTGSLPNEVGGLLGLLELDVSENKLSGDIPSNLGKCTSMERLYLGGNQFGGTIPQSLEALKSLVKLNLSHNNLTGPIPQFLCKLFSLTFVDLSYNNFVGEVPEEGVFSNSTMFSIIGNNNLCDGLQELHLPPCTSNQTRSSPKVLILVASAVAFIVISVSILFVYFMLKKSRKDTSTSSSIKELLPQISYLELSKSTDGFSMDNLIGSGSFGTVYKGVLSNDGSTVAIKVLNLQQEGASKSFVDECYALSNIRHRNLLKVITSCSSIDVHGNEFKALVFNFMSNGNLDGWLHPAIQGKNRRKLSLIQRLNIAIDIACGLDYLHNYCENPIVHCDLKPSNVLLDDDMVAHVGDFGLARFMLEKSSDQLSFSHTMSLALKGSIGYIPPEYGTGSRISIEGDIFSYGILLLEMIIGKRPTDDIFCNDVDIHLFITMALPQDALSIIDSSILFEETCQEEDNKDKIQVIAIKSGEDHREIVPRWMEECLVSIMRIGLACSSRVPSERTSMNIVVNELQAIKNSYLEFKMAH
ncbi:probable LRR receptor-like serine/threonine-protein kinase At3g47570 [Benincasa hispida]|uniref:probable LRR receptor-like serine/threonine-protein kinase At3g47570 n=1 Tax=Benincasa hispida TaxID=102211 RepID=UPI0018FF6B64|nr:probable LRR receptor-like serine/threonine-protein kinase At3g47570 [Benincasa hispida]